MSLNPILSDHSSDEMIEDSDVYEMKMVENSLIEHNNLKVGNLVLVEYTTKKSKFYYAAQIEGVFGTEYQIDCLKRVGNSNRFDKPDIKDPHYRE